MFGIVVFCTLAQAAQLDSFLDGASELTLVDDAQIKLASGAGACTIGHFDATTPFGIQCHDFSPLYFDEDRHAHFGADLLTEADLKFEGAFEYGGTDQWALIHQEFFEEEQADGWSLDSITECSGFRMLGGYCEFSSSETSKEFTDLPDHSFIRVKAQFHFIDEWRGETAYVKLDDVNYVWAQTYDVNSVAEDAEDLCGNSDTVEGKFTAHVDIHYKHSESTLLVAFGTTLEEEPCDKSWGVSAFELYVR